MLIIVKGKEIETKEIIQITESERGTVGFTIQLLGSRFINIVEPSSYDSGSNYLMQRTRVYRELREKVEEKWNEDKTDFIILNL